MSFVLTLFFSTVELAANLHVHSIAAGRICECDDQYVDFGLPKGVSARARRLFANGGAHDADK